MPIGFAMIFIPLTLNLGKVAELTGFSNSSAIKILRPFLLDTVNPSSGGCSVLWSISGI
jgi:hypothetical protein